MNPKSGFVALLGRPNVGKSTLLNRIVRAKVAIVTRKPQPPRARIAGIHTETRGQIVFLDSPGIHKPTRALNSHMVRTACRIGEEADIVAHVVDDRANEYDFLVGLDGHGRVTSDQRDAGSGERCCRTG